MTIGMGLSIWSAARPVEGPGGPAPALGAIAANGWVFTDAAVLTGDYDPQSVPVAFAVQRPGFDAAGRPTSVTDPVLRMKRLRAPYPDGGTLTPSDVALSDYVHAGDSIAGVANGSTLPYPRPVPAWVSPDLQLVEGGTLTLRLFVAHAYGRNGTPVAAVTLSATDGVATASATVAAPVDHPCPLTGLHVPVYEAVLDVSGLADGPLTADAVIYPHVGDTPYRISTDGRARTAMQGVSVQRHWKDGAGALSRVAFVDAALGTPGGSVAAELAAARAAPFDTIRNAALALQAAMGGSASFGRIVLAAGQDHLCQRLNTVALGPYPLRIEGEGTGPGRAGVREDMTDQKAAYLCDRVIWRNIRFLNQGGLLFSNRAAPGEDKVQIFEGCSFLVNGNTESFSYFNDIGRCAFHDCDSDWSDGMKAVDRDKWKGWWTVGCRGLANSLVHAALGCVCTGGLRAANAGATRPAHVAPVFAFNRIETAGGTNNVKLDDYVCGPDGIAVVGNVGALTGAPNDDNVEFLGSAPEEAVNVVWYANTFAGGQHNGPRDNKAPLPGGYIQTFVTGNLYVSRVMPADYDDAGTGFGRDGARRRNWPQRYGTAEYGNMQMAMNAASTGFGAAEMLADAPGLRGFYGPPDGSGAPAFANDASQTGSNDHAGGDYRLVDDSDGANRIANVPRLPAAKVAYPLDLDGTAVPLDGTALAGALQQTV